MALTNISGIPDKHWQPPIVALETTWVFTITLKSVRWKFHWRWLFISQRIFIKLKVFNNFRMGEVLIELYWKHAPITCRNFAELVRRGYYNGTKFHRIIRDFMIQGLCLTKFYHPHNLSHEIHFLFFSALFASKS